MKTGLAAEFKKVFTEELQDKGGYQVVETAGPDVLVLRPALVNVEVNAPDIMSAGVNATVVRSAGQMTLFLELWDPRRTRCWLGCWTPRPTTTLSPSRQIA